VRATVGGALDRALDVAAVLEMRGYGGAGRAGGLNRPRSRHDLAFAASALAVAAVSLLALVTSAAPFEAYPLARMPVGASVLALCFLLPALALAPFLDRRGIEP